MGLILVISIKSKRYTIFPHVPANIGAPDFRARQLVSQLPLPTLNKGNNYSSNRHLMQHLGCVCVVGRSAPVFRDVLETFWDSRHFLQVRPLWTEVKSADLAQSALERPQKGLCGNTNKRLVALAQHGIARAQTLFAPAQVTFGRLSVPRAKRPFAPPQGNFQSFVLNWPPSMALWPFRDIFEALISQKICLLEMSSRFWPGPGRHSKCYKYHRRS